MKQKTKRFNELRMQHQHQVLSRTEILDLIKELGNAQIMLTQLVRHNAIIRTARSQYVFTQTPIHTSVFETIHREMNEYATAYYKAKRASEPKFDEAEVIEWLKSKGYKIFKEV